MLYLWPEGCWFRSRGWQSDFSIGPLSKGLNPQSMWLKETLRGCRFEFFPPMCRAGMFLLLLWFPPFIQNHAGRWISAHSAWGCVGVCLSMGRAPIQVLPLACTLCFLELAAGSLSYLNVWKMDGWFIVYNCLHIMLVQQEQQEILLKCSVWQDRGVFAIICPVALNSKCLKFWVSSESNMHEHRVAFFW